MKKPTSIYIVPLEEGSSRREDATIKMPERILFNTGTGERDRYSIPYVKRRHTWKGAIYIQEDLLGEEKKK
jgi:hypothetical protein